MKLTEESRESCVVVAVHGRVDVATSPELGRALEKKYNETPHLLLELSAVDYISSAGLRVLLMAARQMKAGGGRLTLCNLSEAVRDVLEVSGLLPVFVIAPTVDEALKA